MIKNSNKLSSLLKIDDDTAQEYTGTKTSCDIDASKIAKTKKLLKSICRSLTINTSLYKPDMTVQSISKYVNSPQNINVMLYSEITSYVYGLSDEEYGIFGTNLDKLLQYVCNSKDVDDKTARIVVKVYDHTQLAIRQTKNAKSIFECGIETVKDNLFEQAGKMQREYIAILSIFATIVVAFTAGGIYTASIFNNIGNISIYRLVLMATMVGLVISDTLYLLFYYLAKIVRNKEYGWKPIAIINVVFIMIFVIVWLLWQNGYVELRNYRVMSWFK